MEDLSETLVDEDGENGETLVDEDGIFYTKTRKKWCNNICLKCFSGLVCIYLFSGIIYLNVKCNNSNCDIPNYCLNKIKDCDGSM